MFYYIFLWKVFRQSDFNALSLNIPIGYGLMNYAAMVWVLGGYFAEIFFGFVGFLVGVYYIQARLRWNLWFAMSNRVGLGIGIMIWIIYLEMTVLGFGYKNHPEEFIGGDKQNIFSWIF